jgi:outer membrane protein assembly factor BamB
VIKFFLILIFFLINNCSFDNKSGIWTTDEILKVSNKKVENLFKKREVFTGELNSNFQINTPISFSDNNIVEGYNNYGAIDLDLNLKKISRYKFSKINNFEYLDPTLVFKDEDLIFFDKRGSIIRFDNLSKVIWSINHYSKSEKKNSPALNFSIQDEILIVTDSLSKFYSIDIKTGKLIWLKNHNSIFISDIKIDGEQFYIIDSNNIIHCFSLLDGSKIWEFNADYELIKSQKKLSIAFDKTNIYFNNVKGDLYSLDKKNGNLIWITPTRSTDVLFKPFLLKSSEIVLDENSLYISNNQNSFFSINKNSGFINWMQNIDSNIKPVIIEELIFTITNDGLFFIVDKSSGKILRITNIYNLFKKKKIKKIKPIGFIVDQNRIYLTLSNGRILMIDIKSGKTESIFKIGSDKISKPFVNKNYMFVIKDNEIIKLN